MPWNECDYGVCFRERTATTTSSSRSGSTTKLTNPIFSPPTSPSTSLRITHCHHLPSPLHLPTPHLPALSLINSSGRIPVPNSLPQLPPRQYPARDGNGENGMVALFRQIGCSPPVPLPPSHPTTACASHLTSSHSHSHSPPINPTRRRGGGKLILAQPLLSGTREIPQGLLLRSADDVEPTMRW